MAKAKKSTKKNTQEEQEDIAVQEASAEIEQLQIELAEAKDKYLRLFAEFENFKKRNNKERFELLRNAAQDTLSAILPILDDFDRAKKSADDDSTKEVFTEGVELVYQKIYTVLKGRGLQEMETTGETFDPEIHEAITEIPAPTEDMKGKIIDTVEKGYYLNEKIIRFPKVVVGK